MTVRAATLDAGITQTFSEKLGEENSITLLPPKFDDPGPELRERVARLKRHRNAKHTEGSKKLPYLIPKE
jgi:hypothetical protein